MLGEYRTSQNGHWSDEHDVGLRREMMSRRADWELLFHVTVPSGGQDVPRDAAIWASDDLSSAFRMVLADMVACVASKQRYRSLLKAKPTKLPAIAA